MVKAATTGQMAENITENGKIIKWKETVFSPGLMDVNTKENIKMIKSTVMVSSNGLTIELTKVIGLMDANMEKVFILDLKV